MRIDEMTKSSYRIENANTNFKWFDVPEEDMELVEYLKKKYGNDSVHGQKEGDIGGEEYGNDWRLYEIVTRRDAFNIRINDAYFFCGEFRLRADYATPRELFEQALRDMENSKRRQRENDMYTM